MKFKEKMARTSIEKYGDLGRLIETGQYYVPTEPNPEDYKLGEGLKVCISLIIARR